MRRHQRLGLVAEREDLRLKVAMARQDLDDSTALVDEHGHAAAPGHQRGHDSVGVANVGDNDGGVGLSEDGDGALRRPRRIAWHERCACLEGRELREWQRGSPLEH